MLSFWTQDANWTYIIRSEEVQDLFYTSDVRLIYFVSRGIKKLR